MSILRIADPASGSSAQIAPELGFNCFEFTAVVDGRRVNVLYAETGFAAGDKRPSGSGIPLLFPFPNRIRDGRFHWEGRDFELPAGDGRGNAIHGFCLDRPWRVTATAPHAVTAEFQLSRDAPDRRELWPADFLIEVRYEIRGSTLRSGVRIANPGETPLPWGFGTHAYFHVPLTEDGAPERHLVQAPAARQWELVDCLPSGRVGPVGPAHDLREGAYFDQLQLDDVLTGLEPDGVLIECVLMDERAGLQVVQSCPREFREIVAYTPPHRRAVCLEPYTCVTDAINLQQRGYDAGLRVLAAGEEFRTRIDIAAGPVLA